MSYYCSMQPLSLLVETTPPGSLIQDSGLQDYQSFRFSAFREQSLFLIWFRFCNIENNIKFGYRNAVYF
jgi:hypothetical protein